MTQMPKGAGSMTLDYDLSNRVSGVSHPDGSEQYRYAPDNRRVWRSAGKGACFASRGNNQEAYWGGFNGYGNTGEGPTEQLILYSPGGQKMGAYCVGFSPNMQYFAVTASEENVYYGGRLVGKRIAALSVANSGVVSAFTADRLQSKGNGSNYYPYGESKTSTSGDDREGFATYTRDEKSGLDYADQRWYASGVGRFTSPDPYFAAAPTTVPDNWNRYTYVGNSPTNFNDPNGLFAVPAEGSVAWLQSQYLSSFLPGPLDASTPSGDPSLIPYTELQRLTLPGNWSYNCVTWECNDLVLTLPTDDLAVFSRSLAPIIGPIIILSSPEAALATITLGYGAYKAFLGVWKTVQLIRGKVIPDECEENEKEGTPDNPRDKQFSNVRGTNCKIDNSTGEIWCPDTLHKDHWEVFRNRKKFESNDRHRGVWRSGCLRTWF
jgi:RHS repeat-associated protein